MPAEPISTGGGTFPRKVIIAKTTENLVIALTDRVKALHSYDCPCIVALPIDAGNVEFLDWISNQVKTL